MKSLDPEFLKNFMGFGNRRANFLGHGVGLQIDEPPVIAEGFDETAGRGMVLALEPKKGVPGVGMVGSETPTWSRPMAAGASRGASGTDFGLNRGGNLMPQATIESTIVDYFLTTPSGKTAFP